MEDDEIDYSCKEQFNKQAEKFSNWSVTQNEHYLREYKNFIGIKEDDTILDVACGTGEFDIFLARHSKSIQAVDFSEVMIEMAKRNAAISGVENVNFYCYDVNKLNYPDNSFSVVVSKSAFHHIETYEKIFDEMKRCCKKGGLISTQDIIAYPDKRVNKFFEDLEKLVDKSHFRTLEQKSFDEIYQKSGIHVLNSMVVEVDLHFKEYMGHAIQSESDREEIEELVQKTALSDPEISKYFFSVDNELYFKRKVYLVVGRKEN